jgi:hypothetical protein
MTLHKKISNALKGVIFQNKTRDDYTTELISIADDYAIEFSTWCANKYVKLHSVWVSIFGDQKDKNNWKTAKELLEIFKREK